LTWCGVQISVWWLIWCGMTLKPNLETYLYISVTLWIYYTCPKPVMEKGKYKTCFITTKLLPLLVSHSNSTTKKCMNSDHDIAQNWMVGAPVCRYEVEILMVNHSSFLCNIIKSFWISRNPQNKKILQKKHLKLCTWWFVYFLQVMTSYQENKQPRSMLNGECWL